MIDDRWISQVDLTLVAIFGRLVEETGEKNRTFCELGSFHRVSVSVKSQLFKDFKDQDSRSSHPCTRHCSGIGIQRFPQVIQVFLLLWGCSMLLVLFHKFGSSSSWWRWFSIKLAFPCNKSCFTSQSMLTILYSQLSNRVSIRFTWKQFSHVLWMEESFQLHLKPVLGVGPLAFSRKRAQLLSPALLL